MRDLEPISKFAAFNSWRTLPLYFGIVMFAFDATNLVLAVENRMYHPQKFVGITGVLTISCAVVFAIYYTFGICGYLRFGDRIKEHGSLTLNLPQDEK